MRTLAPLVVALLAVSFLSACTSALLAPDDRKQVCRVAVDEEFGSPVVKRNALFGPKGPLLGAGVGALVGLEASGPTGGLIAVLTVPFGAFIGFSVGLGCAGIGLSHPNAEADFETLLRKAADGHSLRQALEADLNVPRAGCGVAQEDASAAVAGDTVIAIEKLEAELGCPTSERQIYSAAVTWRVINARDHRVLGKTTTTCTQTSLRDFEAWFADPDGAQVELERVLAKIGRRMAEEVLSSRQLTGCSFHSVETGEIEAR